MSKHQITAEIRIKAILDEAQKELQSFSKSMAAVWESREPPKNLLKSFEALRGQLTSLQEISKNGVVSSAELGRAENEYKSFTKNIHNLKIEFQLFTAEQKRAMLSTEEQNAMKARAAAIDEYTRAIEKNKKTLESREALLKEQSELDTRKKQLETSKEGIQYRINNLNQNSNLSKEAALYAKNLQRSKEIEEDILKLNQTINAERKKGTKEESAKGNALTRAKLELEKIEKEKAKLDLTTGKDSYTKEIANYSKTIKQLEDSLSATSIELDETNDKLKKIDKELLTLKTIEPQVEFNKLKEALKNCGVEAAEEVTSFEELREIVQSLDEEALQKVEKSLEKARKDLDKLEKSAGPVRQALDEATDSIKEQNEAIAQREAFERRIKDFLGIAGAAQVMRSAFRDAMQTITELDATMTEMSVVTDLGVSDYWDQLPDYTSRANKLGLAINDVYKADTLFYQQGLKTNEVVAISTETMKMARIAGIDTALATDRMTAALRGFNMELNETSAQRVADVYSKLAAITAADVKEISSAMSKTASIASSAGMEFETTAAFLSQIIETTRESAETAGTALKTVIARFQELKKSPDEIGEVEGEIVDANAIEGALRSVGVALRDSRGQFRELDDVFLELSSKWSGLDKNTQRYIATIAAGSRQQSRFIAMMSDYGRTQELVNAANASAGASNKQFEKTLESLESKLAKLKNAWHEFTMGILESDAVKFGVDVLTKFLEVINKATGAFNGLAGSVTKIASLVAIFKLGSKIFEKFKNPILNLFMTITKSASAEGYNSAKNWHDGAKKYWDEQKNSKNTDVNNSVDANIPTKKKTFKSWIGDKTGFSDLSQGFRMHEKQDILRQLNSETSKRQRQENLQAAESQLERAKISFSGKNSQGEKNLPNGYKRDSKGRLRNASGRFVSEKKIIEQYEKKVKDAKKAVEDYADAEKEALKEGTEKWNQISSGMQKVGETAIAAGVGISMLGSVLSSLGLEEVGEGVTKFGNAITIAGTAITALTPIIQTISSVLVAGGIAAQAAWWWAILIVAAVAALIVGIIAIAKEVKKSSPEGKLKAAQEAAEAASEAADAAAESYNNLNNALSDLEDKYKALDKLTRGTQEWNSAVMDINDSVMNLVEQYPELSEFLTSKKGVLTLDLDNEALQQIVTEAQTVAVAAKNSANIANGQVALQQGLLDAQNYIRDTANDVYSTTYTETFDSSSQRGTEMTNQAVQAGQFDNPFAMAGYWFGTQISALIGASSTADQEKEEVTKILELGGEDKTNIIKALAENLIYKGEDGEYKVAQGREEEAKALGINNEYLSEIQPLLDEYGGDLRSLGKGLIEAESALKNSYKASAENTKALISLSNELKPEQKNAAWKYIDTLLNEEDYETFYNEALSEVKREGLSQRQSKDLIKSVFGEDAKWDEKTGKVTNLAGETIAEGINYDDLYSLEANRRASADFKKAGESAYGMVDVVKNFSNDQYLSDSAIENLFSEQGGLGLTRQDISQITSSGMIDSAWVYWENFTQEQRDLFGNDGNKFVEFLNEAVRGANEAFDGSLNFQSVTAGTAKSLTAVANTMGEASNKFVKDFNEQMNAGMSSEQQAYFSSLIAQMSNDPTNRGNWDNIFKQLANYGIVVTDSMREAINSWRDATNSVYSEIYLSNLGVSDGLISQYQDAIYDYEENKTSENAKRIQQFHEAFEDWKKDYDIATSEAEKAESELRNRVIDAFVSGYEKELEALENGFSAIEEANDKLLSKISEQIEQQRQLRENEKAEKEITNLRSQAAYLGMDTSGTNALAMLDLDKELKEAEQDYQDSLVDQAITKLEDANTKAAEQRERQIYLAEQQLEAYKNSDAANTSAQLLIDEAAAVMASGGNIKDTALGKLLRGSDSMDEYEEAEFWNGLNSSVSQLVPKTTPGTNGDQEVTAEVEIPTPTASSGSMGGTGRFALTVATKYKSGGLADFTGPAWLDGTKSRPEYVLNAAQTERFFSLVDILEKYEPSEKSGKSGDNYFEIEINVEKLENDYDVEKVADKIRRMIYEDASYRNVNAINHIR